MDIFYPDQEDPGFRTGQWIKYNGRSWLIEEIRPNSRGIWVTLVSG
jgi:hypothetical protein